MAEFIHTPTTSTSTRNESFYHKERERKVLELYHTKGKRYSYITKELKISPNTISDILKRDREEKEKEREKEKSEKSSSVYNIDNNSGGGDDYWNGNGNDNGNGDARARPQKQPQMQQQQQQLPSSSLILSSLSPAAELENLSPKQKAVMSYKLYDQGKTPLQVPTALCLTAKETITYHREFLRLKGYYKLYQIYLEIEQSLPSFLKLFKGLKKHGLNPQNVEWYVDTMNIGMKLEDLEPDYENVQSKNQSLRSENQDIVNGIQYNRRIFENQSRAMQEHITGLFKVAEQQQQNVDTLSERIAILYIKEQEQERIVSRFKDTNKTYRKVKSIAEEQVNKFWSQALKEPDKKGLFSIVLSSMAEALRQNPQRYDIIFNNDNNNDNSNNNAQKQDAVLEVSNRVSNALIEKLVNDTMATLESQTESEDTELHAAEETESKDKEVAAAEDETKPEE